MNQNAVSKQVRRRGLSMVKLSGILLLIFVFLPSKAQFVHPGIWHKKSDLDRMKHMVEMKMEPWYGSYLKLKSQGSASYSYVVRKDPDDNTLSRENPSHQRYQYESDAIAAYHNSLMWYITGDARHAQKSIEILNAWADLTSFYGGGTEPLCAGLYGAPLINAAEIIKNTYSGWSAEDVKAFGDMLVYPGYSNTTVPTQDIANDNVTFYWRTYMGDPGRHGNQGLLAWRTVMAIGIFLDNEIIYDRALRQIIGLPHRADDLPYPSGPAVNNGVPLASSNEYYNEYSASRQNSIPDYGFDDQIQHYIYENGQCQESSRDQAHSSLGVATIGEMMEVAWNQGTDIYSYLDDRLLLGYEYTTKYNMSEFMSFPDQPEPWEPTVESGEFLQKMVRCGRWQSLKINPWVASNLERKSRGEARILRPVYEMPVAHFTVRENKSEAAIWSKRARDYAYKMQGSEEGDGTDAPGWGGLTFHRPDGCAGDPIIGFANGVPDFSLHQVPGTLEAENFDFFSGEADGRTFHDSDAINASGKYRQTRGVDIDTCSEGGYAIVDIANGEWLTYTIAVPATGLYDISINYAAANANGKIKFSVADKDISSELTVPFGGEHSNGLSDWKNYTVGSNIILKKGVQALKVHFMGATNAFQINSFEIEQGSDNSCEGGYSDVDVPSYITPGINFSYYEGQWDALPDFSSLTPVVSGINDSISLNVAQGNENFAFVFSGYIAIPLDGMYTFYVASDEGSRLFIDGHLIVDNDGLHLETEVSGGACLYEGFHEIKVEYFEKTGEEKLSVTFEGPGISRRNLEDLYAIGPCENQAIPLPEDAVAGISYYYYEGEWTNLPDFETMLEADRGIIENINLSGAAASDYFGMVFKGYFNVPEDGDYTFYTTSDDGSRISIDGKRVVSHDGTHGATTATGSLCLAEGYHELVVEYFDNSGGHSLKVEWEGDNLSRRTFSDLYTDPVKEKESQTITFNTINKYLGEADFDPGAIASSGLPITYTSYNTNVITIVNNQCHIVGVGQGIMLAQQPGNINYKPAETAAYFFVKAKEDQTIQFDELPVKYVGDADFDPGAIASSGLPLSYTSTNENVATIVDGMIHIVAEGKVIILARQAGNNQYNSAQEAVYLTVESETAVRKTAEDKTRIFPNPASDVLIVKRKHEGAQQATIINALGVSIRTTELIAKSESIDVSQLPAGIYILKLSGTTSETVLFMKQ